MCQVDNIQAEGEGPTYHLLCVVQQTELQPYGFKGQEMHLLPLVPDIVTTLHPQQQLLVTAPPEGVGSDCSLLLTLPVRRISTAGCRVLNAASF